MKAEGLYQFAEFELDALSRTLRRESEIVTLNRRAFDVLLYLVQNPGRLITREELLKNVWPDTSVDENSLAQSVSSLRRALAEKPGDNNYIVTLPGRGYQFVSQVKVLTIAPQTIGSAAAVGTGDASGSVLMHRNTIRTSVVTEEQEQLGSPSGQNPILVAAIAILAVAAIAVTSVYILKQLHPTPPVQTTVEKVTAARRSIAVLGFRNLSGRPEESWLSTALAEMLSTELVAGEKLRLVSGEDIARTKLDFPIPDTDSLSRNTLTKLHKSLGSDLVVLGSYTALGERPETRIRLDLRLQDTAGGDTIADIAVSGNEANLFDLVSDAGAQLREKLGVEAVSPVQAVSVRASLPSNPDAARLYSEGLARLRVFDALAARDLLQRAVAADPKYSLSHSALAGAWSRLGYDKKAQQEAKQAFELSDNLSREERLWVEGRYREIDHQYEAAIEIYRTLFKLFPDNLDYGLSLASVQARAGKGHDALDSVKALRRLGSPASEDPRIDLSEADAWEAMGDTKHQEDPQATAVAKARAQGERLVLASALASQCWEFGKSAQVPKAIAACREASDLYATAGDQRGQAVALRAWADAITEADAPEAIRIYKRAQAIFQKMGSEGGLASVLNNLGLVYEAQGDLAEAESMHRQSLAIYKSLEDGPHQAVVAGNVADERLDQGDLTGAEKMYEESQQLDLEDTGHVVLMGYNIALIHQLEGDLASARQGLENALTTWQKSGSQDSVAYAMWSLGNLMVVEADFTGARKMYEQSLSLRTSAGDKVSMAETELVLASLSLEEGRTPADQEAAARRALAVFQEQKLRDDEAQAWCALGRALFAEGKSAGALEAMGHARTLAAKSQNPEVRWETVTDAARIESFLKKDNYPAAVRELSTIVKQSETSRYLSVALEARLALGEIEMKYGQTAAARVELSALEMDAKTKGFLLVAHKAALARG